MFQRRLPRTIVGTARVAFKRGRIVFPLRRNEGSLANETNEVLVEDVPYRKKFFLQVFHIRRGGEAGGVPIDSGKSGTANSLNLLLITIPVLEASCHQILTGDLRETLTGTTVSGAFPVMTSQRLIASHIVVA